MVRLTFWFEVFFPLKVLGFVGFFGSWLLLVDVGWGFFCFVLP